MLKSDVWERSGQNLMSKNLFAFMISFWIAAGIALSAVAATYTLDWEVNLWFLLGVLVVSIVGVVVAVKSDNPLVSLVGYALVAGPFGMLLGPVVAMYTEASVIKVFIITTGVVGLLGLVGVFIPDKLEGWGSWLFGGLILLILGYFIVPIAGAIGLPIGQALTWLDWLGVLLFSGYVIYDWNRAMHIPYTMDNAIDVALAVYLDFINIFLRLLSLTGTKKD